MALKKIDFEDKGQDLLYFIVDDETHFIEEAGPFHNDIYKDLLVVNYEHLSPGEFVHYIDSEGDEYSIKYPIVSIQDHDSE